MKKVLSVCLIFAMLLTFAACGGTDENQDAAEEGKAVSSIREVRYEEGSSYGISFVVEGPAPVNNKNGNKFHAAEEETVLLDDENLKAVLIGTFEQKYGAKEDRKLGKGAVILFTNKSEDDYLISMGKVQIGDQEYVASNLGCPNQCNSGQQIQMNFLLYRGTDAPENFIEDFRDVYKMRGEINTKRFVDADNITDSRDHAFSASGDIEEVTETTAPRVKREHDPIHISKDVDQVVIFDEPIVLVDNEYLKVEMIEFFQKNVNWTDEKGHRQEKGITLKTTNKHNRKLLVKLEDLYIGEKQVKVCMNDGSIMPIPGKAVVNGFYVWNHSGHIDMNLEDINDLFQLEGTLDVREYGDEHLEDLGEFKFYVS